MAVLITFNVAAPRNAQLIASIKALGDWGVLTPSSYLVDTRLSPGAIMERLHQFVAPNEDLWVLTVSAPWASYGNVEVEDLAEMLGPSDNWVVWDWDEATSSRPTKSANTKTELS